jgi:riboflavin biosynthesis pyrimidine reductase
LPEIIRTLIDRREASEPPVLPEDLRLFYGGDLRFPPSGPRRPYVIGNFVSTVDGVVSYEIRGKSGGGDISGFDESDRFIMGLLRASADAVMVGSRTLHQTAREHLFVADCVCPESRDLYACYRSETLKKTAPPLQVVVSGSGRVDLTRAIFVTPGIRTLIVTAQTGRDLLAANGVESLASTEVRSLEGPIIAPASILELLHAEYGISILLHEGGPTLFGRFVADGCVDELFLTVAPQVAGRNKQPPRPGFIAGVEFLPGTAPWLDIISVKARGNHLYLRYVAA